MTVHEGIGIRITDKNTIIKEITTYLDLEAYQSIKLAMKKRTDQDITKYNFLDDKELLKKLSESDNENELLKIRNAVHSEIECTYITGAYKMLSPFNEFLDRLNTGVGDLIYLETLITLVDQSNTSWQKVMRTLQIVDMDPSYVLWQVLIFSNTAKEVVSKTYSGMNKTTEDDDVLLRVIKVFRQIVNSLHTEMLSCNKEELGFYETENDTTPYPKDMRKSLNCPSMDSFFQKLCKEYHKYLMLLDKLLYKNHLGNLKYTGYENFDPMNWLLTAPKLEKKLEHGSTYLHFTFTDDDKKMNNVNSISNDDWALNYSKLYFDSVYKVLNPFRQLSLQLMAQTSNICQNHWKIIQFEVLENEILFTNILGYCNDIKSKIGKIIEQVMMNDDKLQPLYENWKKTFDAKFEYEVTYDNAFQDIYPYEVSVQSGSEFNFGKLYVALFKNIDKQISSYKTDLFDIENVDAGVINMFKRSVFKELSKNDEK